MKLLPVIFKRQLASYALAPVTYLHIALFLVMSTALGLYTSDWLDQGTGDLQVFFQLHAWLYLLLIPALVMRLWSDEANPGFLDLMKTLPITAAELTVGKFLAAWVVAGMALVLTFPLVITANYLGTADNGVIASQYMASWLLAGSYLAAGSFVCTLTSQRSVIFILTRVLLLTTSLLSSVLEALEQQAPIWIVDSLSSLNPLSRFSAIDNGRFTLHDSAYFISMIFAFLTATIVTINYKHR